MREAIMCSICGRVIVVTAAERYGVVRYQHSDAVLTLLACDGCQLSLVSVIEGSGARPMIAANALRNATLAGPGSPVALAIDFARSVERRIEVRERRGAFVVLDGGGESVRDDLTDEIT